MGWKIGKGNAKEFFTNKAVELIFFKLTEYLVRKFLRGTEQLFE